VVIASAGLFVVAIVLFVLLRQQQRTAEVERKLEEIESEPIVARDDLDPTVTAGEAVRAVMDEYEERRAEESADEAPKAPKRARRSSFEVRHLGHLDATSESQRETIDELIGKLVQLDDPHVSEEARAELIAIRRAAIPRLLNRFVGLKMNDHDQILLASLLHQTLSEIAKLDGEEEISFVPQEEENSHYVEMRRAAIQAWFQWWGENEDTFE